jgi:hypothetical protein
VSEPKSAKATHHLHPARQLRSGAWLLQRSWRHPHRLPAGWRSERFARSADRTRPQLGPIHTLRALVDSFEREGIHLATLDLPVRNGPARGRLMDSPLGVAYTTRWIELDGGRELHASRTLYQRAVE